MVDLVQVNDEEFEAFLERSVRNYASEKVKAGNWPREGAFERSSEEFGRLLPDGRKTPDNYIFKIVDNESGMIVGNLWVAVNLKGELPGAYIFDIYVDEEYRGKGYGRATMMELEKVVKGFGYNRISLQVFGHNKIAFSLYESCGYGITNIVMSKTI